MFGWASANIEKRVVRVLGIRKVVKYGDSAQRDGSLVKAVVETYGWERCKSY